MARLIEFLAEQGLRSWCAPHELRGAQVWRDEIGEALERCGWFAVFLAPSAVSSVLDTFGRRERR